MIVTVHEVSTDVQGIFSERRSDNIDTDLETANNPVEFKFKREVTEVSRTRKGNRLLQSRPATKAGRHLPGLDLIIYETYWDSAGSSRMTLMIASKTSPLDTSVLG